ncbi:hypothetical protein U1Q18_036393, partial [Sarracenia purpurea var. burkii]
MSQVDAASIFWSKKFSPLHVRKYLGTTCLYQTQFAAEGFWMEDMVLWAFMLVSGANSSWCYTGKVPECSGFWWMNFGLVLPRNCLRFCRGGAP